jgi:hypothetical protein
VCLGDPSQLACVLVAWPDSECNLLADVESFKLVTKATWGVAYAMSEIPNLAKKVDAIFCDRDSQGPHKRFGVLNDRAGLCSCPLIATFCLIALGHITVSLV